MFAEQWLYNPHSTFPDLHRHGSAGSAVREQGMQPGTRVQTRCWSSGKMTLRLRQSSRLHTSAISLRWWEEGKKKIFWQTLQLVQMFRIKMQSFNIKPRLLNVHLGVSLCVRLAKVACSCVFMWLCVSVHKTFLRLFIYFFFPPTVPVRQ